MSDDAHEQIEVAASPARCFARAIAFEDYPQWASNVKRVVVHERDEEGRGTLVELHVAGIGRTVRSVVRYDYRDAPSAFSWSLVEGDLLRALDGRYTFSPSGSPSVLPWGEGTRIDYWLRIDLAMPMPALLKRKVSGMIIGNALGDLRRALEHDMDDIRSEEPASEPASEPDPVSPPSEHPDAVPFEEVGTESRPLPPPSVLECVITELLGAVPEVRDHVLEAADALLDAARTLVDAADRVVRQQRGED